MKIYYRNEEGQLISKKEWFAKGMSIYIPPMTGHFDEAENRLNQLKSINKSDIELAVSGARDILQRIDVDSGIKIDVSACGMVTISSPAKICKSDDKTEIFTVICEEIDERIKIQSDVVEFGQENCTESLI